ncbi:MAG: hypothetical protein ACHQ9S_06965 [Candidatus Binatia bacterium]
MDRRRALTASEDEAYRLAQQSASEVTPSRHDFSLYVSTQKQQLAVIARLGSTEVLPGQRWGTAELVAHARACDDAEVAALAVTGGVGGLSMDHLAAVAAATTAPVLRDDPIVHPSQLYEARLHGADAVLFALAELGANTLQELVGIARSLHMTTVLEVLSEAQIEDALDLPHVILGLRCTDGNGALDVKRTRQLAQQLPRHRTLIVLPEIRAAEEYAALDGVCDAVVIGEALLSQVDEALRRITGS